jgi:hypothetical protein
MQVLETKMEPVFLVTILTCNQVIGIVSRLRKIALLSPQQQNEIVYELQKAVPSCPVKILPDKKK